MSATGSGRAPLRLFTGYGIEIESMVVDADTLEVRPIVDELLRRAAGADDWVEDVEDGAIAWSNEFVAHVVELKTNGPAPGWEGLAEAFRASAAKLDAHLAGWNARLLPTGMHPWMDPTTQTTFWAHDHGPVYRAYHRLFDARRHGWANLQSVHLNLPFGDEHEFARLMAATRLVLPLVPALAASTPIVEGRVTGLVDNRLEFYRTNSERVAAMTGDVIPEPIYDAARYRDQVLAAIDRELLARGADEVLLGNEWTNARGAIARFDRMAIEVRLIDAQECAAADLAVAAAVSGLIRALVEERWSSGAEQRELPTAPLASLLVATIARGADAPLDHPELVRAFGLQPGAVPTVGALVAATVPDAFDGPSELRAALEVVLEQGPLARRILLALGDPLDGELERARLREVYRELADCLATGRSFVPGRP